MGTRIAVIVVAVLAVVGGVLSACGSDEPDQFVGTWRESGSSAALVIAKTGDGYLGTLVFSQAQPTMVLTRNGDTLSGTFEMTDGPEPVEIVYLPDSGHIRFRNGKPFGEGMSGPVELARDSASTAIAVPSPL